MKRLAYTFAYLILLGLPASVVMYIVKDDINIKGLLLTIFITLIVGGSFDIWATRQDKNDKFFIWEYNSRSILGFKIYGVPIEDFVFFLVLTPIFVVGIYLVAVRLSSELSDITSSGFGLFAMAIAYHFVYRFAIKSKS